MKIFLSLVTFMLCSSSFASGSPKTKSGSFVTIWVGEANTPIDKEAKKELALERCAEQATIYASEKLGKRSEYVDYVISKVVMKKQFDSWQEKNLDGKYVFGAKAECQFSIKILNKLK